MSDFYQWLKGEGEGLYGRIIRHAGKKEARRLRSVVADGDGLFPHIDHETKERIEKAEAFAREGQQKIEKHKRRQAAIDELMPPRQPLPEPPAGERK